MGHHEALLLSCLFWQRKNHGKPAKSWILYLYIKYLVHTISHIIKILSHCVILWDAIPRMPVITRIKWFFLLMDPYLNLHLPQLHQMHTFIQTSILLGRLNMFVDFNLCTQNKTKLPLYVEVHHYSFSQGTNSWNLWLFLSFWWFKWHSGSDGCSCRRPPRLNHLDERGPPEGAKQW